MFRLRTENRFALLCTPLNMTKAESISRGFYRGQFLGDYFLFYLCARDQDDGEHYDRAARQDETIYFLVKDQPAEEDGDHRIHVGIGRDLGRGNVFQQPDVSRVADPGATDNEVSDGGKAAWRPHNVREISVQQREHKITNSRRRDLPTCRTEHVHARLPAFGKHRA